MRADKVRNKTRIFRGDARVDVLAGPGTLTGNLCSETALQCVSPGLSGFRVDVVGEGVKSNKHFHALVSHINNVGSAL